MGVKEFEIIGFGLILGKGKNIRTDLENFLKKKGIFTIYSMNIGEFVSLEKADLYDLRNDICDILDTLGWKLDFACPYYNCEPEKTFFYICSSYYEQVIDLNRLPHMQGITSSGGEVPAIDEEASVGMEDLENFRKIIDDLEVEHHEEWNREPYLFSLHHVY